MTYCFVFEHKLRVFDPCPYIGLLMYAQKYISHTTEDDKNIDAEKLGENQHCCPSIPVWSPEDYR